MTLLLLLLALSDPGGHRSDTCERKPGKAQCVEVERRHEKLWRCRASCFVGGRTDGGVYPVAIRAEKETADACRAELDRQAANGCQP